MIAWSKELAREDDRSERHARQFALERLGMMDQGNNLVFVIEELLARHTDDCVIMHMLVVCASTTR